MLDVGWLPAFLIKPPDLFPLAQEYDDEESTTGIPEHLVDSIRAHERTPSLPSGNSIPIHELKRSALQQLPPRQRALQLIEAYFEIYVSRYPKRLMNGALILCTESLVRIRDGNIAHVLTRALGPRSSIVKP